MDFRALTKQVVLNIVPDAMLQPIKKIHYARTLKYFSPESEKDLAVVSMLVAEDDCVVDIGANIGIYTKFLSELAGVVGRVYSIEPVPTTFDILSSNVKKFGLANVALVNCAISDTMGSVTMEVPRYESGGENFYRSRIVFGDANKSLRKIMCAVTTIDDLLRNKPSAVSFIKCDAEGNELGCIRGALEVIEKFAPAWLIELSGDPDSPDFSAHKVFALLCEKGYEGYWFDGKRLQKRQPADKSVNYFFLQPKHIQKLNGYNTKENAPWINCQA